MKHQTADGIDVYPVGILHELIIARGMLRSREPWAWRQVRYHAKYEIKHLVGLIVARKWHHLRNHLNGYLAEPTPWPAGLKRCGSGWTRRRALADLRRRIAAITPEQRDAALQRRAELAAEFERFAAETGETS